MRVFVVGATGTIAAGSSPQLIERGHEVIGSARSSDVAGTILSDVRTCW